MGLAPAEPLAPALARAVAAALFLFGAMFAVGGAVLLEPVTASIAAAVALAGALGLMVLRARRSPRAAFAGARPEDRPK